jgi:peptidylprolyl isomerase
VHHDTSADEFKPDELKPDEPSHRVGELRSRETGGQMRAGKPEVDFPGGEPPAELEITDIWEGDGKEAKAGDTVEVNYVGVAFSTGEEFDASWNRGEPLSFRLGAGQVIAGWDQGIQGMKVGGRRQLIIPPDLGYGNRGAGNAIRPGETLIFVCDLVSA